MTARRTGCSIFEARRPTFPKLVMARLLHCPCGQIWSLSPSTRFPSNSFVRGRVLVPGSSNICIWTRLGQFFRGERIWRPVAPLPAHLEMWASKIGRASTYTGGQAQVSAEYCISRAAVALFRRPRVYRPEQRLRLLTALISRTPIIECIVTRH